MTYDQSKQRKAAHIEAQGTWISPTTLSFIFAVALVVTVALNGI